MDNVDGPTIRARYTELGFDDKVALLEKAERLARAKETGYEQTVDDRLGERMNTLHNRHSLRYPFQVNRDDNPRGAAWLRSILAGR